MLAFNLNLLHVRTNTVLVTALQKINNYSLKFDKRQQHIPVYIRDGTRSSCNTVGVVCRLMPGLPPSTYKYCIQCSPYQQRQVGRWSGLSGGGGAQGSTICNNIPYYTNRSNGWWKSKREEKIEKKYLCTFAIQGSISRKRLRVKSVNFRMC